MRELVIVVVAAGCWSGSGTRCEVNADCPGGLTCSTDHACYALDAPSGLDATFTDGGLCHPDHDGRITRDEVVVAVPATLTMRTSGQTAVDLHGTTGTDGVRRWDFSGPLAGDQDVPFSTAPVAGAWFASGFPMGQFTTPIAGQTDLLGVYAVSTDRMSLLGAASSTSGFTQTELTYDPAVDALVFPLHVGQHWQDQSTVSGTADGVLAFFTDTYTAEVDASGEVVTPYGTFPVLRTRVELRHEVGLISTTTVTFAFIAECFGPVATVTARSDDTSAEPTTAASVARLAP